MNCLYSHSNISKCIILHHRKYVHVAGGFSYSPVFLNYDLWFRGVYFALKLAVSVAVIIGLPRKLAHQHQ